MNNTGHIILAANTRDALRDFSVLPVLQGETRISTDPDVVFTTILGSCVSACIWDGDAAIGGINHFLIPGGDDSPAGGLSYGVNAMELLVNGLIRQGASRGSLKVKLLGGAKMRDGGLDIGASNAQFAKWFVQNEGFDLIDCCLGGRQGRSVRFWPVGGRIQRRFMADARALPVEEVMPNVSAATPKSDDPSGEVQLF